MTHRPAIGFGELRAGLAPNGLRAIGLDQAIIRRASSLRLAPARPAPRNDRRAQPGASVIAQSRLRICSLAVENLPIGSREAPP